MKNLIQAAVVTLFAASTAQAQQASLPLDDFAGSGQAFTLGSYADGTTTGSAASAANSVLVAYSTAAFSRTLTVFFQGYGGAGQPAPSGSVIIDPVLQRATLSLGGGNCCYTAWNLSAVGVEYSLLQGNWINLAALGDAIRVDWISASSSNVSLGWRVTISDINGRQAVGTRATSGFGTEDIAFTELSPAGLGAPELSRVAKIKVEAITLAAGWGAGFEARWGSIGVAGGIDCNNDGIIDYGQCHDGTLPDYNSNNIPDCCERGETCVVGTYSVQWRVEDGGNGHWYGFGAIAVGDASWMQMRDGAVAMGGHLLTLSSAVEDDFAFDLWRASQPFQGQDMMAGPLGYFVMPGGTWQSVNGEPMTYTNWRPATTAPPLPPAPDNGNAVHRFATWLSSDWGPLAGRWEDWLDSELGNPGDPISPFMVEWDADCNSDGIVDYGQILQGQLADLNTDGVPDVCQQPTCVHADLFRDFNVNGADLGILLSQWGPSSPLTVSDINSDGVVNGADLGILLSFWGPCP